MAQAFALAKPIAAYDERNHDRETFP